MENSMKRHYYNDPLAAAWMATHHKFKLQYADIGGAMHDLDCRTMLRDELEIPSNPRLCRVYVHPDSVPLLKPQVGDIAVDKKGTPWIKGNTNIHEGDKIIQRGGKPFFMPESEDA